jgi:hypothetical protein
MEVLVGEEVLKVVFLVLVVKGLLDKVLMEVIITVMLYLPKTQEVEEELVNLVKLELAFHPEGMVEMVKHMLYQVLVLIMLVVVGEVQKWLVLPQPEV